MKKIQMQNGSTIEWDGAGVYVAIRRRGPTNFVKLPTGMIPEDGVLIQDFSTEPKPYVEQEQGDRLWRKR